MSQTASGEVSIDPAVTTQSSNQQPSLTTVYAPVASELEQVETILQRQLRHDTPLVNELLEHSWLLGGKRIRPVLLLLAGACAGRCVITPAHRQLAAALEMIHTATLIHDDILDEADTRRHRPTANAVWGVRQSILLGDYLFTHSFYVAAESGSAEALRMLAQASNRVCEGEIRQNSWQGDFDLDEASYLRMITEKTAELCGVGCQLGAFLSGASTDEVERFADYGRQLGVAFQIIDDVLDIVGHADTVGKTLGTDILNQKPTLPVIHALANLPNHAQQELKQLLIAGGNELERLIGYLEQSDSLEYARQQARNHAQHAIEFAQSLPASEFSSSLVQLAKFVLFRTY